MARKSHSTRSTGDLATLYQQITDRIIVELEKERVPWIQPWGTAEPSISMPYNAVSERRYSGINILILWNAIVTRGFSTHAFLTFRQAIALGGSVRRGERGIGVICTRPFISHEEPHGVEVESRAPSGSFPFLKFFTVFSVDQCDGLPPKSHGAAATDSGRADPAAG